MLVCGSAPRSHLFSIYLHWIDAANSLSRFGTNEHIVDEQTRWLGVKKPIWGSQINRCFTHIEVIFR
jgi:hypothetical protein